MNAFFAAGSSSSHEDADDRGSSSSTEGAAAAAVVPLVVGFVLGSVATIAAVVAYLTSAPESTDSYGYNNKKKKKKKKEQSWGERLKNRRRHPFGPDADNDDSFFSDLIRGLWPDINAAASRLLKETVEPLLKQSLSGTPFHSIRFAKCDLGRHPVRIENIVVHKKGYGSGEGDGGGDNNGSVVDADDDNYDDKTVRFDLDFGWKGSSCEIQLATDYLGTILGLRDVTVHGRLSFIFHTTDTVPVVNAIQYSFVNPPTINFDFTGLAQIADSVAIVKTTILSVLQDTLASMMIVPNRMLYKVDTGCNLMDIYQPPLGVARIELLSGEGFQVQDATWIRKRDIPDVYCLVSMGHDSWRSPTVKDSTTPVWKSVDDERGHATAASTDFLYSDHNQVVSVHAYDEDNGPLDSDDDLGSAQFTIWQILLEGKRDVCVDLMREDGTKTGATLTLSVSILPFTTDLSSFETQRQEEKSNPNNNRTVKKEETGKSKNAAAGRVIDGLVEFVVTEALDLPVTKDQASSFVKVAFVRGGGGSNADKDQGLQQTKEFVTATVVDYPGVDALNPLYDSVFYFPLLRDTDPAVSSIPVLDDPAAAIQLSLMNQKDVLGTTSIPIRSLTELEGRRLTERRSIGYGGASLEFRVALRGVQESGINEGNLSVSTRGRSDTPSLRMLSPGKLGIVRITVVRGRGFKDQKRRFRKTDIVDPYCRIKLGSNPTVFRTTTKQNTRSPSWIESTDFPVRDRGEIVYVDVFDCDKGKRDDDDHLGAARISVGQLLLAVGEVEVTLKSRKNGSPTGAVVVLTAKMICGGDGDNDDDA